MKYLKLYENFNEFYEEMDEANFYLDIQKSNDFKSEVFEDREIKKVSNLFLGNRWRIYGGSDKFQEGDIWVFTIGTIKDVPYGSLCLYDYTTVEKEDYVTRSRYWKLPRAIRATIGPKSKLFNKKVKKKYGYRHDVLFVTKSLDEYYYVHTIGVKTTDDHGELKLVESKYMTNGSKAGSNEVCKFYKCDQIDGVVKLLKDLYY